MAQHGHPYVSLWTIHNNKHKHPLSQFQLFNNDFGHCWYLYRGHFLLSVKIFCCHDQLIPRMHELDEIWHSHCNIIYYWKVLVVFFLENCEFYIQVLCVVFGPRETFKSLLTFFKVHIVGTIQLVHGSRERVLLYAMNFRCWDSTLVAETDDFFWEWMLKNDFGTEKLAFLRFFLVNFYVTFPWTKIFSISEHGDVIFLGRFFVIWACLSRVVPILRDSIFLVFETNSFTGWRFLFWETCTKTVIICSSRSLVEKTSLQSNGSCNIRGDSHFCCKIFEKLVFSICKHLLEIKR